MESPGLPHAAADFPLFYTPTSFWERMRKELCQEVGERERERERLFTYFLREMQREREIGRE